jgi:hypothetical protein
MNEGLKPAGKMSGKATVGGPGPPRINPDRPCLRSPNRGSFTWVELGNRFKGAEGF